MIEDMVCHCRRENVFDVEESPQSRHRHNQCFLVPGEHIEHTPRQHGWVVPHEIRDDV